jgi:predicted ATPase
VRISLLGGLRVEHDGQSIVVSGAMQLGVLFRLAVDAGRAVSVRAIVEDVWGVDAPENEKAALQSVISRLRSQLPPATIESSAGGYRLAIPRESVDALACEDLVAAATAASGDDAARLASQALELWIGEPWVPSENFDGFERDLRRDRAAAIELGGSPVARPRTNVAVPLTELIGRATELATIAAQLGASRLVTVVGTGGAGKTRLAIETALGHRSSAVVELAPVGPGEVLGAVLAAIGRELRTETLAEQSGTLERIVEGLFGRDFLLVLDNCEHVIGEAATVAEELLGALPQLRILATSREPLAIPGEAFVAIGSLPQDAALELFRQRATAAQGSEFTDNETAAAICVRLDGLPLAIELAAARLRTMTVDEVLVGLEDRFTLLTGGYRTALPRHQTLRAMIDWSWSLLGDEERLALAQLAVFPSGVDAADADALAELMGLSSASTFDSLVDKSLLQRSRGRYRTLETIREYGIEKLAELGKTVDARELQARHESDRAREIDRMLRGPRINHAISWFDAEEDNLSAALRFATTAPLPEIAVRLVTSSAWYWIIRDRQDDSRVWFPAIIPLAEQVESNEARVLQLIAPVARALSGSGEEIQDPGEMIARGMSELPSFDDLRMQAGDHELLQVVPTLVAAFSEVAQRPDWMSSMRVPLGEDLGLDPWPVAVLHIMRAAMAQNRGDVAVLDVESQTAVTQFEAIGDLWGIALSKQLRTEWLIVQGRLEEALEMSDEATASLRSTTSSFDLAQQQGQALAVLLRLGRIGEAQARAEVLLEEAHESGNSRALLQTYVTTVMVDLQAEDLAAADQKLEVIAELESAWPGVPGQLHAMAEAAAAGADVLRGDLDSAERHLRSAAEAAFSSHDQPVIGHVAVSLGALALARGDIPKALRAVDLATVLIGAYDGSNPHIVAIEAAAREAGIGRAGAEALTRPIALEALKHLAEH